MTAQITAIENAANRAERERRTTRRLEAMERLAREIERTAPALMDVVETLQRFVRTTAARSPARTRTTARDHSPRISS